MKNIMTTIIILTALLGLLVTLWVRSSPLRWYKSGIHWILPIPLFGNTFGMLYQAQYKFWIQFYEKWKYEKIIGFHWFTRPCLMINDLTLIHQLFVTDSNHFSSYGWHTINDDTMAKAPMYAEGKEFEATRSKLSTLFTPAKMKSIMPLLKNTFDIVDKIFEEKSNTHNPIDMNNLGVKVAVHLRIASTFGFSTDVFEQKNSFFYKLQKEVDTFLSGIKIIIGICFPWITDLLGLTFMSKNASKELKKIISDVTQQRAAGIGVRSDIIQSLINVTNKSNSVINSSEKIGDFDDKWLRGQVTALFVAGTESISNMLTVVMYEIGSNPAVQEKIIKEISEKKCDSEESEYDILKKLSYTESVFNELLRKYIQLSTLPRCCIKDYTYGDLTIKKGTYIVIPLMGIHMDPNIYPEPEKFIPERFSQENFKKNTFFPFGLGTRICTGQNIAKLELIYGLYRIFSKYQIKLNPLTKFPLEFHPSKISFCPNSPVIVEPSHLK